MKSSDPILLRVDSIDRQAILASVEKVYSDNFSQEGGYPKEKIEFVGASTAWGNVGLQEGERAIAFISYLENSSRYYQGHMKSHFSIHTINGETCAVANWNLKEYQDWEPAYVREATFYPDKDCNWKVAIPLALFEKHMLEMLNERVWNT